MDTAIRTAPPANDEKTLVVRISEWIMKHRKMFLIVLGALAAVAVLLVLWVTVAGSIARNSTSSIEKAEKAFVLWEGEGDQAKKDELGSKLLADLESIGKKWPRTFAGQQAFMLQARVAQTSGDWAKAEGLYLRATQGRKDSFLAPIALKSAALAAEESGSPENARKHYVAIIDTYKNAAGISHALFSAGRLSEKLEDRVAARTHYQRLVSEFPEEAWANLARNRLIHLDVSEAGGTSN